MEGWECDYAIDALATLASVVCDRSSIFNAPSAIDKIARTTIAHPRNREKSDTVEAALSCAKLPLGCGQ